MKFILACLSIIGLCAAAPMPQTFTVEQFELLMIEYTSPTTVDAIDANGPASKIYSCMRAGAAGTAQSKTVIVPTCIAIVFKGPITRGAVAVQPVAANARVLFWTSEALDYDAAGHFAKGDQPQGPFKTSAECAVQSKVDIANAYAKGTVAKGDSLIVYCVPILKYGETADGAKKVDFKVWPGSGDSGSCFWTSELSEPCEMIASR